ncbi:hypothetical protein ACIBVL_43170 [Streptomyces sp. NPDC049687]|uniref:hypothetical protein n=1 Tax=Streptomyces sp. NPDC049687 TaxID=3365596 RepID=UPI0037AFF595
MEATSWTRTTLGLRTEIQHASYAYTVQLHPGSGTAYIARRHAGPVGTPHRPSPRRPSAHLTSR